VQVAFSKNSSNMHISQALSEKTGLYFLSDYAIFVIKSVS